MKSFLLLIVAASSVFSTLNYDSIASYSVVGPPVVPVLTVIRSADELDNYCLKTNGDTSNFLKRPDFSKEVVVGLLTVLGGGNRIRYRIIKRVVTGNDSVFLEVQPDSQVFNNGISIEAGAHVLLITILKTNNEIVLKEIVPVPVSKHTNGNHVFYRTVSRPENIFDIQGRQLLQAGNSSGSTVIVKTGMKKVIPGASKVHR
ncbi:MAG TPA: hypothetical protein VHO70_10475 [Chitinispirillaceae bacterium]|nr:hypothetical protein [Chitinispirillaceae bacterium]